LYWWGQFKGKRTTDVDQPKNISSNLLFVSNDLITRFKINIFEKDIEYIGFENFDQVRNKISIRVSRKGLNTFYPFARGPQYNLI
jgi:2-hydroxy-3-keto-5-methylthiopentenyl-1-phosphate phosphatase